MKRINVFIAHRWTYDDYDEMVALLDRSKYNVSNYSVPRETPFNQIDDRYKVDPQIKSQINYASFVVFSNRPANNNGMTIEEIKYAISIGKPVVAIRFTKNNCSIINDLGIDVISKRKDSLETWIYNNL